MTTTSEPGTRTDRLHGLDALRAAALGLGIVLHSLMPFLPFDIWPVLDARRSDAATGVVVWIHLFRMVLFMALAGYFGRMVLHRRGPRAYLRDRSVRILLPLLVFGPIMVVGVLGVVVAGLPAAAADQMAGELPSPWLLLMPMHLWFLAVLMQCVLVTVAVRAVVRRLIGEERLTALAARCGAALAGTAGLLLAALPYVAALLLQGSADGGIVEPGTILPQLPALTGYLGAFLVGWFLHAHADALSRIARAWPVHLGIAVVLTAVRLAVPALPLPAFAAVVAVAGWAWAFALIGLAVRYLNRENPVVRYLADASYWMYILHLVVLMVVELPMARLDWPILVKLLVAWVVTAVVTLGSYDLLVRGTWVGAWLNGHRRTPAWRAVLGSAQRRVRR